MNTNIDFCSKVYGILTFFKIEMYSLHLRKTNKCNFKCLSLSGWK